MSFGFRMRVRTTSDYAQFAKIFSSDGAAGDFFGLGVSVSGDGLHCVISAQNESTGATTNNGAVYYFSRISGSWVEQQKITAPTPLTSGFFGFSVALSADGSTLVVGERVSPANNGRVLVFYRSTGNFTHQQTLTHNLSNVGDSFGYSVAVSDDGNTLIGGAIFDDNNTSDAGSAVVFTRSGSTWTEQTRLNASDAAANDEFGVVVSLSSDGNTAAVGARSKASGAGAVYVFTRSGSTWSQQQKVVPSNPASGDNFGSSVSLSGSGDLLIVGAPFKDYLVANSGSVYAFSRSGSVWSQSQQITPSDVQTNTYFNISVISRDGSTIVVGLGSDDTSGNNSGALYVFKKPSSSWEQHKKLKTTVIVNESFMGTSVAVSGDGRCIIAGAYGDGASGAAYSFNK